jgi:redox-sensing transcriptional repressor
MPANPNVPEAVVSRLAAYLRALDGLATGDATHISSADIGALAGVSPDQVRKDLSHFGEFGRPGIGYDLRHLRHQLAKIMRLDHVQLAVQAGAGSLGSALARYSGLSRHGFRIAAVFDIDEDRIGIRLGECTVEHLSRLPERVAELGASIGIIAVPTAAGQSVATIMEDAGIRAILNFAPVKVKVGENVKVRSVDLGRELECLAYYLPE